MDISWSTFTYLGPFWSILTHIDPSSPILIHLYQFWPILINLDLPWLQDVSKTGKSRFLLIYLWNLRFHWISVTCEVLIVSAVGNCPWLFKSDKKFLRFYKNKYLWGLRKNLILLMFLDTIKPSNLHRTRLPWLHCH